MAAPVTANRKVSDALTTTGSKAPGQARLASAAPTSTMAAEMTMHTRPERTPGPLEPAATERASTKAKGAAPANPRTAPMTM